MEDTSQVKHGRARLFLVTPFGFRMPQKMDDDFPFLAINLKNGVIRKDITVFEIEEPRFCHPFNSYASPTPVVANGSVFVHFGSAGTACIDTKTEKILWARQDLPCDHHRGPGSSPIFFANKIFLNFDGYDQQYVSD